MAISEREHPLKIEEKLAGACGLKEIQPVVMGKNMVWSEVKTNL
jgi:hypothetical protein